MTAPVSALVVAAHPDDIELTVFGTLRKWVTLGTRVDYLICTSGEAGIDREDLSLDASRDLRESEQRLAAERVGASEVIFLREPDGSLENSLSLRRRIVREIRRLRPQVLVTGEPDLWVANGYVNHPDHRAASAAAIDAAFPAAGRPRVFAELAAQDLRPHRVTALWMWCFEPSKANVLIDIADTLAQKSAALAAHASQFSAAEADGLVRAMANRQAQGAGSMEAFRVVELDASGA